MWVFSAMTMPRELFERGDLKYPPSSLPFRRRGSGRAFSLPQLPEMTLASREKKDARASAARNRPRNSGGASGRSPSRPMERPPGLRPGAGGPWEMRERLGTGGFGNVCLYQHRVRRGVQGSGGGCLSGRLWNTVPVST